MGFRRWLSKKFSRLHRQSGDAEQPVRPLDEMSEVDVLRAQLESLQIKYETEVTGLQETVISLKQQLVLKEDAPVLKEKALVVPRNADLKLEQKLVSRQEFELEALRDTVADLTEELQARECESNVSQEALEQEQKKSAVLLSQLQNLKEELAVRRQQDKPQENNATGLLDMDVSMLQEQLHNDVELCKLLHDDLEYNQARLKDSKKRERELRRKLKENGDRLIHVETNERRCILDLQYYQARLRESEEKNSQLIQIVENLASKNLNLKNEIKEHKLNCDKLKDVKRGNLEIVLSNETLKSCEDKDESCHNLSCHSHEADDAAEDKESQLILAAEREAARLAHLMRRPARGKRTFRCREHKD